VWSARASALERNDGEVVGRKLKAVVRPNRSGNEPLSLRKGELRADDGGVGENNRSKKQGRGGKQRVARRDGPQRTVGQKEATSDLTKDVGEDREVTAHTGVVRSELCVVKREGWVNEQ
jgi:hypothetical protein